MGFHLRGWLLLCLCLAFWLRLWGFGFGLPYNLHPDEHQYVDTALTWHTTGELETRFVNLPLFTYFLIAVFAFWFAATPFEPTLTLLSHTYLFARLWSVAFSLFTVALMYPLGKKLGRPRMGLLAAALMAGLFLPAREAHFAVNDTFVTFLVLLTLYFCLKLFQQRDQKSYIIAGAMVGLTTGTKLTAALVILPVLVAHVLAAGHKFSWSDLLKPKLHLSLGWGLLAAAGTFLIVVLPLLWQLPQFLTRLRELAQFGAEGFGGVRMGPATGWQFYLDVLGWGMGWTMLAALLAVLGYTLIRYKPEAVILLIFPLVLFAYMGSQKAFSARYLLPAVPPLVLLVTLGLSQLAEGWSFWRKHQTILMPLALFILLGQSLVNLVWFDYLLNRPNTQQLATTWFIENFPEDTVVAKEPYSILPQTVFLTQQWPYKVITLDRTDPGRSQENYYLSRKTELIAVSNFTFARIREKPAAEQIRLNQLKLLAEKAILLKEFNPYRRSPYSNWFYLDELYGPAGETLQRVSPGPLIRIYRLPYENQPYTTEIPPISVPVEANFANKLVLLGYDLPARRANPGESFPLTLYWQAAVRLDQTYVIFNHLLDQHQQNWGGYDRWPQETANTVLWQPGEVVVDTFNLPVAVNAPPGIYTIDIGLYNQADRTATPLSLLQNGQPINQNSVRIGPVKVGEAPPEIRTNKISPQYPLSIKLGQPPLILFHGYDLLPAQNGWELTLYWESLAQMPTDWTTFIHLRDETGQTVAQKDGPTGRGLYPTSLWDRGDMIVDHIILPTQNIPAGRYNLFIGLYDLATGQRLAVPSDPANEFRLSQQVVLSNQ